MTQIHVHVIVYPIAGLCDVTRELDVALDEGGFRELSARLREQFGVTFREIKEIMFLHNGCGLDISEDTVFKDGDQLWLMPKILGG